MGGSSQTGRAIQRDNSEHSGTAAASARGRGRVRIASLAARGRLSRSQNFSGFRGGRARAKTPRAPREAE